MHMPSKSSLAERHRYKQVLPPLRFPEEETVTESDAHLEQRLLLRDSLKLELASAATVGSKQFVYWNARDPGTRLAPDVFVKLGHLVRDLCTWKTWEHGGVPELAVEITSPSDAPKRPWAEKFERYSELGVRELVRFSPEPPPAERLQIWDRVDENLLEREVGERAEWSEILGLWWVIVPHPELGPSLRLARDPAGADLLLTPLERALRGQEDERRAREAAEQRVQELEAELGRRRG
jgi:hypothetical protein